MKAILPLLLVTAIPALADESPTWLDLTDAQETFATVDRACKRDGGKLWGATLCGPLMLVDPDSRAIITNATKAGEGPTKTGVFASTFPAPRGIANTSVEFGGLFYAQVQWPPRRTDAIEKLSLLLHESFHRVQNEHHWPNGSGFGENAHLDSLDGRYWLQLEWRALAAALKAKGAARREAIADALAFRAARWAKLEHAPEQERALIANEGLAEYTGLKLAAPTAAESTRLALENLDIFSKRPSFVRSFAYASGPAYGLLLDDAKANWRQPALKGEDLGDMLAAALPGLTLPGTDALDKRAALYDGAALRAREVARDDQNKRQQELFRRALVSGPVLKLPLDKREFNFDPNTVVPLAEGSVYPAIHLVDAWGVLHVAKNGALMSSAEVSVPAPSKTGGLKLAGDGWSLELNKSWAVVPGPRAGDFVVRRQ